MTEEFEAAPPPDAGDEASIVRLAQRMVQLEAEVADAEKAFDDAKERLRLIAEDALPKAMEKAGVERFDLVGGRRISVGIVWRASIAANDRIKDPVERDAAYRRRDAWFAWLREKELDDVIKRVVGVEFGRGKDAVAAALAADLRKRFPGAKLVDRPDVNAQTLLALVREQARRGVKFPDELGVSRVSRAKIEEIDR